MGSNAYYTPLGVAIAALRRIENLPIREHYEILDPGAGTGMWGKAMRALNPGANMTITAVELMPERVLPPTPDYDIWLSSTDFISNFPEDKKFDIIIGNPPYQPATLTFDFLKKGLRLLSPGGHMLMLLRMPVLLGSTRYEFWTSHKPYKIVGLAHRASFTLSGGTDMVEHQISYWQEGNKNPKTEFVWMALRKDSLRYNGPVGAQGLPEGTDHSDSGIHTWGKSKVSKGMIYDE